MAFDRFPEDLLPADDAVRFYERHGWWVSPPIVEPGLLDAATDATRRFYLGKLDEGPEIPQSQIPRPPYGNGIRAHLYASLRCRELAAVTLHPLIGAIGARLARAPMMRLWHDQLVYKPPEQPEESYTRVGWHTDGQYWRTCSSTRMLTAWVPLDDVDEEIGTLMVADGSNHWSESIANKSPGDGYDQDLDAKEDVLSAGRPFRKVVLRMRRGQVSFHSMWTYHASGPNRTDHPRISISIHMQDGENRFSHRRLSDGSLAWHLNNDLVRANQGVPDFTDPRYCPTIWAEPPLAS